MIWTPNAVAISYAAYQHRKEMEPIPRKAGCRVWTPDLLYGLRVLAAQGYGSRDISRVLGMDRKAVQNKACREKIKIAKKKAADGTAIPKSGKETNTFT